MAAVVFCGILHAGGRYFYCEALGLALTDPCAHAAGRVSSECPLPTVQRDAPDCCAVVVLAAMPDGAATESARVPPSPAVAWLPVAPPHVDAIAPPDAGSLRVALHRWRLPPKPPGEARARLMVFLI